MNTKKNLFIFGLVLGTLCTSSSLVLAVGSNTDKASVPTGDQSTCPCQAHGAASDSASPKALSVESTTPATNSSAKSANTTP